MNKIITIGRELGSGGRELGRRLSEELGYAYYDQEILAEIAKRTELSEKYVKSIVERKPMLSFPIHIGHSFQLMANPIADHSQKIYQEQCNILREMAENSDCVIVGCCADYILRELNPYRIFVYAEMEGRMTRCRQKEQSHHVTMTDKELKQHIKEVDKHRAQYYGFYTDQKWGDRNNYDLCVNTTNANIKDVAAALVKLFK